MSELNDLFEEDPLELVKDQSKLRAVIAAMRDMRYKFNLGDTRAGSMKPKAKPKALKNMDDSSIEDLMKGIKL